MSFYEWHSKNELHRQSIPNGDQRAWFVAKYDGSIRKQACLIIMDGNSQRPVAYFKSEADAIQFADDVFGGVKATQWIEATS